MEVLVLADFTGSRGDEMTVRTGDVVKKVTKASEDGWLEGELRGKRGIFPVNFVKEVPVYLIGDSKREPRSLRKTRINKQSRKCEVAFAYTPMNEDELGLVAGETVEILREIEDGWWMGMKNGKVGAFPSNFVKEIFVSPKDTKITEGKTRPKLSDAMFNKEQRTSVRSKKKNLKESCQVMFDYTAFTEDELDLKKGDIVTLITKETEDEGWWEGELRGRRGFFPDNFVMVIPPTDSLQLGNVNHLPARQGSEKSSAKAEASAMEKAGPAKLKDEKPESKDLRSNPPTKVKLPSFIKPSPPPVKDKPNKLVPKANGDSPPQSPKLQAESDPVAFDEVDVSPEKLSHPTANRAKPPHRRPPSAGTHPSNGTDQTGPDATGKKPQPEKPSGLPKVTECLTLSTSKAEPSAKTPSPARPALPKGVGQEEKPSLESVQAEIKELKMALELLQARHKQDIEEVREELRVEKNKRTALQEEVQNLRTKH